VMRINPSFPGIRIIGIKIRWIVESMQPSVFLNRNSWYN